ncbi:uncharacterized protein LOC110078247 [Pogona vitticeps]
MGMEQSIQGSGVFLDVKGYQIRLTRISDLQPDGEALADVVQRASEEVCAEDELQGRSSELEKSEGQPIEEASPDGMTGNDSGEENVGQSDEEQEKSDGFSMPAEISKTQVLQENSQEGDQPVSVPKSVMDTEEESKMASEINSASCCSGDNTEGTQAQLRDLTSLDKSQRAEQTCELDVGGQSLEHTLVHLAHEKPTVINKHELPDETVLTLLKNETAVATDETMNFTEVELRMPAVGALPVSPSLEAVAWTSSKPSAKTWLEISDSTVSSSIKEVDKAFLDEPALEKTEAPKVPDTGERCLSKEDAQICIELRVTPVDRQAEAVTEDAEQTQACFGDVGSPVSMEKPTDAPNEEDKLLRPLISGKRKRFCCTIL